MYLILPTDLAEFVNWKAAKAAKCKDETVYRWNHIDLGDGTTALDVGDGKDLSEEYLSQCVKELPAPSSFKEKD